MFYCQVMTLEIRDTFSMTAIMLNVYDSNPKYLQFYLQEDTVLFNDNKLIIGSGGIC